MPSVSTTGSCSGANWALQTCSKKLTKMGPINVFVEAIGLVAIAYATFGVVSFLEVKNKYEGGFQPSSAERDDGEQIRSYASPDSSDDFADFVSTSGKPKRSSKGKPKKNKRGASGPRACLPVEAMAVRHRRTTTRCPMFRSSFAPQGVTMHSTACARPRCTVI